MSGEYSPRMKAYFGSAVLHAGFMPVPHLFTRHYRRLGLTSNQAMFLLQLMAGTWDLGDPPRTVGDLARRLDVDTRTVRRYCEELSKLELLRLYDQFDASGAQVENAYDLSPLFTRLAELKVTEPEAMTYRRSPRPRRSETERPESSMDRVEEPAAVPFPPPMEPAPSLALTLRTDHTIHGEPDRPIHDGPDRRIRGARIRRSGLKGETRIAKKLKETGEKQHGARHSSGGRQSVVVGALNDVSSRRDEKHATVVGQGRSLRWDQRLTAAEVTQSRELLDRAGILRSVAAATAPTLHPAEVWSIRIYARAARLSPAWIATQIYRFDARRPQPADLPARYDEAGRLLAGLAPCAAETLLEQVDRFCPRWPDELLKHYVDDESGQLRAAGEAIWAIMAEQRGGVPYLAAPASKSRRRLPGLETSSTYSGLWLAVHNRLRQAVPHEDYETWLEPASLLEIEGDIAVVMVPNVFARDEVAARYGSLIEAIVASELGRPVHVELVIGALSPV